MLRLYWHELGRVWLFLSGRVGAGGTCYASSAVATTRHDGLEEGFAAWGRHKRALGRLSRASRPTRATEEGILRAVAIYQSQAHRRMAIASFYSMLAAIGSPTVGDRVRYEA
jgi:hypothetical protein